MIRHYWAVMFTGTTWEEFLGKGARIVGFRERRRKTVERIHPGDYLICYVVGISRLIGVLEVKSEVYLDNTTIWKQEKFPCRLKVKLLHKLKPEHAIPVSDLKEKLFLFTRMSAVNNWGSFFRASPAPFDNEDGRFIKKAIERAIRKPIAKEYSQSKYWRRLTNTSASWEENEFPLELE